jgi:hypothetical protein
MLNWEILVYWLSVGSYPIGSMYAIYGNIYHQYTPFMLAYIPYMDPMGIGGIRFGGPYRDIDEYRN